MQALFGIYFGQRFGHHVFKVIRLYLCIYRRGDALLCPCQRAGEGADFRLVGDKTDNGVVARIDELQITAAEIFP